MWPTLPTLAVCSRLAAATLLAEQVAQPLHAGGWQRWEDVRQKPSMTGTFRNAVGRKHTEETGNAHHTATGRTTTSTT